MVFSTVPGWHLGGGGGEPLRSGPENWCMKSEVVVVDDSPTVTIQNLSQLAVFLPSTVPTKMHQPPNSKDIFTPN